MKLDFIGYEIRLTEGIVTIARKNILKVLYAFMDMTSLKGFKYR